MPSPSPTETLPSTRPTPTLIDTPDLKSSLGARYSGEYHDCTPCRLMGSGAFVGLGAYTFHSGMKQLREREVEILSKGGRLGVGGRKAAVVGMSVALVGVGVWRLFDREGEWGV